MGDTNYISGIVKILENPIERTFNKNISITQFRVQLPQIRNNSIVNLVFWGKLSQDINNYYKINDYIIIEGYLSLRDKKKLENSKSVEITVLKVYPFILSDNLQINRL
jgi:single-stranded DNA-binding protein